MFAYSNSGQSMRAIDTGMEEAGETVFDHNATDAELAAAFPAYVPIATLAAQAALKAQARQLLSASDVQVARSYESGIVLPDTWKTYRAALRVIVSTGAGTIPALPAWPS